MQAVSLNDNRFTPLESKLQARPNNNDILQQLEAQRIVVI